MAILTTTLIIISAVAGVAGVGLGVQGGVKMRRAGKRIKAAQGKNENGIRRLEDQNLSTCTMMDALGQNEMEALSDFQSFTSLIEKINETPEYAKLNNDYDIPVFTPEEIKKASLGASLLVSGLGGATLGTAGGFAASSATTAAVMALGTASTGATISSLSGVAATNATLAAIGGGSLAAGGGGMALGTAILGAASLGVGLLIGGVIFTISGSTINNKAETAERTANSNCKKINKIITYLKALSEASCKYNITLSKMRHLYSSYVKKMEKIIENNAVCGKVNWLKLSQDDKVIIDNTILIVGLIYNMCKVNFVMETAEKGLNKINQEGIDNAEKEALKALAEL